ncbi:MAG: transposase, partial [Mastigocoleus sp.]
IRVEQVIKTEAVCGDSPISNKAQQSSSKSKQKRGRGRPKGSKNKNKAEVTLTSELLLIKSMVVGLFQLMAGKINLTYLLLDGHFGNHNALQMARQTGLHLISKLRCDSALYLPYQNPNPERRSRRKYGDKLDYKNIPAKHLCSSCISENLQTNIYQIQLLHKEFSCPLNVVIVVKTNLNTQACSHVILFSSDLELSYEQLIDYYKLRFQIEFNFRDAKQFWGLEDFMNLTQTAVTNAANLSLFMVNVSHHLLADFRTSNPNCGILDLKAYCQGFQYVYETIKMLPQKPEPILLGKIFRKLTSFGRIHPTKPYPSAS